MLYSSTPRLALCSEFHAAFKPIMYIPTLTGKKLLCGCKHSGNRPLCNGSHLWVKCNNNTPLACAVTWAVAFGTGVLTTFLMHG